MKASSLERTLQILSDYGAFLVCFWWAYWLQFHSGWITDKFDPTKCFADYLQAGLILNLGWTALFALTGLYRKWLLESRTVQVLRLARTIGFGILLVLVALFGVEGQAWVFNPQYAPETFLYHSRFPLVLVYGVSLLFLVSAFRMLVHAFLGIFLRRGYGADRLLMLGATQRGEEIVRSLQASPGLGQRPVGFMDERFASMEDRSFAGLPVLGKYSDLPRVVRERGVNGIVICHDSSSHREVLRVLVWVADMPVHIYVVPDLYDVISGHFRTSLVHGVELKELFAFNMPPWQVSVKRLIDICVASALLVATLPLTLLAALSIKIEDRGPIFYSQERVGLYGRRFFVHKFRTMVVDAEKSGPQWAAKNDSRVTRTGRFLRRSRIDEVPQLWCVLRGDMSMVGPRPEREHFIEMLREEIPFYVSRLKMKPGLTGWAQVRHHYDTSIDDVRKKLTYDLYYYENMSLMLDLQILFRTVWVVVAGKGAQ